MEAVVLIIRKVKFATTPPPVPLALVSHKLILLSRMDA